MDMATLKLVTCKPCNVEMRRAIVQVEGNPRPRSAIGEDLPLPGNRQHITIIAPSDRSGTIVQGNRVKLVLLQSPHPEPRPHGACRTTSFDTRHAGAAQDEGRGAFYPIALDHRGPRQQGSRT